MYVSRLEAGDQVSHDLGAGRGWYLYVIDGDVAVNGSRMVSGSAARISEEPTIGIVADAPSELIAVDVSLD